MPLSISIIKPLTDDVVDVGGGSGYVVVQTTVTGGTPYQVKAKIYPPGATPDPAPPLTATLLSALGSGVYSGSVPGGTCGTYYPTLPQFQVMAWAIERNPMTGQETPYPANPTFPYGHCGSSGGSSGGPAGGGSGSGTPTAA